VFWAYDAAEIICGVSGPVLLQRWAKMYGNGRRRVMTSFWTVDINGQAAGMKRNVPPERVERKNILMQLVGGPPAIYKGLAYKYCWSLFVSNELNQSRYGVDNTTICEALIKSSDDLRYVYPYQAVGKADRRGAVIVSIRPG